MRGVRTMVRTRRQTPRPTHPATEASSISAALPTRRLSFLRSITVRCLTKRSSTRSISAIRPVPRTLPTGISPRCRRSTCKVGSQTTSPSSMASRRSGLWSRPPTRSATSRCRAWVHRHCVRSSTPRTKSTRWPGGPPRHRGRDPPCTRTGNLRAHPWRAGSSGPGGSSQKNLNDRC